MNVLKQRRCPEVLLSVCEKIASLIGIAALSGCAGYSYTLNERLVFTPPKLFSDYTIADAKLQDCVQQAIEDQKVTAPEMLAQLNCSNAGIASLKGLEIFTGLKQIGLDGNQLGDISALYALKGLELLQLRNNRLGSLSPSLCKTGLKQIALSSNTGLDCSSLAALQSCGVTLVDIPEHCGANTSP